MNIVVLRALGIGDLLTALPALRGIRRHWPEHIITLAAPAWLMPLVKLADVSDRLLPQDGLNHPIRTVSPPDIAVNLHGRGPQSHRLLAATGAKMLAFGDNGPAWHEAEHEVHRWCRMLAWFGVQCDPGELALPAPSTLRPAVPTAIVHAGAKDPARRWPAKRFGEIARWLTIRGYRVMVTGSKDEAGRAAEIGRTAGLAGSQIVAGRTTLAGLISLAAAASLIISGDTGMAHLATAFGTPSVVLFHRLGPHLWGPPADRPQHRSLWHPEAANPLVAITVDEVRTAIQEVARAGSGYQRHIS